jgi:hypothetical protein
MVTILALLFRLLTPHDSPTMEVSPVRPKQGSLLTISVRNVEGRGVSGRFAGEPLHFEPHTAGFRALAAVPVDAPASLMLEITPEGHSADAHRRSVPIARGQFRTQRLRVASQYGREPSPATKARIEREVEQARQVSVKSHQTPRMWRLPFIRPTDGRVTSPFGTARLFNGKVKSRHNGLDFGGGTGAPVKAANDGIVALVGSFYLGGNCIYVDHGAGLVTAYLHLSKQLVKVGQQVKKGQLIGRIGATGRVTGPHLHFITRYGAISVNPLSLLALREHG